MGRIVVDGPYEPMPIVGYGSRSSVKASEDISFHVSCKGDGFFRAQLVRLFNGDLNPQGPGLKEVEIQSSIDGSYSARFQQTYPGSYGRVADPEGLLSGIESFSLYTFVFPTNLGTHASAHGSMGGIE